ncbi:MAG: hypothetical protein KC609_07645 [Myxococcales bacterium]|nr:hypothetical protein [Myxococcales bacterium]
MPRMHFLVHLAIFLGVLWPLSSAATEPPMPVYDGCVVGSRVRIVTGLKSVTDRSHNPYDLSRWVGKRIRFRGYLQREPTLVIVDPQPTVVGPCRGTPSLPRGAANLITVLRESRRLELSKGGAQGEVLAAVVKALDRPLMSGTIAGRVILSQHFVVVGVVSGRWSKRFRLSYDASIARNERAVELGEVVVLVPRRDKRTDTYSLGTILQHSPSTIRRVKQAIKDI